MHVGWGVRLLLALALATGACARPGELAGALRPDTDEGIAEATILTLDDFPSSWDQQPVETIPDPASRQMTDDLNECLDAGPALDASDLPHASSPWFYGPSGYHAVQVTVSVAPGPGGPHSSIGLLRSDAAPDCYAGWFAASLSAGSETADVDASEVTVELLPQPRLGDEAAALRATREVTEQIVVPRPVFDLIVVRVGRVLIIGLFASVDEPFDPDHSADLLQTMVDRAMSSAG